MRLLVPLVLVAALTAGCGVFQPAACEPSSGSGPTAAPSTLPTTKTGFAFRLPEGDRSPNQLIESAAYEEMSKGKCPTAEKMMQRKQSTESERGWADFGEPREVLLYQAGLELCKGNTAEARKWFDRVNTKYKGWKGIGWDAQTTTVLRWHVCEMYRNVASVLDQKPEKDFKCARYGDLPDFIAEWETNAKPDPRK